MSTKQALLTAAAAGVLSIGMMASNIQSAQAKGDQEKCYGIVKAGANDCGTSSHSCAAHSTKDNAPDEWIFLPKGLCERIAGGSTEPK